MIHYLETPPSREILEALISAIGVSVREVMRTKESLYKELNLENKKWHDSELIDAMLAHPILINRPIVVTPLGTRLCRPSEEVLALLSQPQLGAFNKEDGEAVVDENGQRVDASFKVLPKT